MYVNKISKLKYQNTEYEIHFDQVKYAWNSTWKYKNLRLHPPFDQF